MGSSPNIRIDHWTGILLHWNGSLDYLDMDFWIFWIFGFFGF